MKAIYLIEDHDEALRVWKRKRLRGFDLVHLDAHIDFMAYKSRPIEKIVKQARSLKELKSGIEYSIAFRRYEKNLDKQTHIGNYIYPAMEEGIVSNFYWVIPGDSKKFNKSFKDAKTVLGSALKNILPKAEIITQMSKGRKQGRISVEIPGKKIIVCTLKTLPIFKQEVLLDIDTDFLVIDSLLNASNRVKIGKRKPWISPLDLVGILKNKIPKPKVTTIAYSVNGGWTPMEYKHLADEMAFIFAPRKFKKHFKIKSKAAEYFKLFNSTGKQEYYQKAVRLNPAYRAEDNNYGPLYLFMRKFSRAHKEFSRILKADPKNIGCLFGLGKVALERKNFKKARKYFCSVLNSANHKIFKKAKKENLFGLAKAEFYLKNFNKAKELLCRYRAVEPLDAECYYFLGRIYEKQKEFGLAIKFYKDSLILGFKNNIEIIWRILRISKHLKKREEIIKFIVPKYSRFKKEFKIKKDLNLKKRDAAKSLIKIAGKISAIEKMLQEKYEKK